MLLNNLKLFNFRNITTQLFEPIERVNVLYGKNAQGKTNFLEAINILLGLRSFRTNHIIETIKNGEPLTILEGKIDRGFQQERKLLIRQNKENDYLLDGKKAKSFSSYVSECGVISFSRKDSDIYYGDPSFRRRYLDRFIFNVHNEYFSAYRSFNKILKHRNELLKKISEGDKVDTDYFEVINDKYIAACEIVLKKRNYFLKIMDKKFKNIFSKFSFNFGIIHFNYKEKNSFYSKDDQNKIKVVTSEKRRGTSLFGPHLDDYEFISEETNNKIILSQGQVKTMVAALKLAEIELFHELNDDYPIVLIDDLSSEIDDVRKSILIENIIEKKMQTFISCTSLDPLHKEIDKTDFSLFEVEAGKLIKR